VPVSWLLTELVAAALWAAEIAEGDVDPTVGAAMAAAGYDRDFGLLPPDGPPVRLTVRRPPSWRDVVLDAGRGLLTIPAGVVLDLGATAKAWMADRAAARADQPGRMGIPGHLLAAGSAAPGQLRPPGGHRLPRAGPAAHQAVIPPHP
jgi:thiamine biosynthesis lipoprotein ApbE